MNPLQQNLRDYVHENLVRPVPPPKEVISFELGKTVCTPGIYELIEVGKINPVPLLQRHQRGDWGEMSEMDEQTNNEAVINGDRILSSYKTEIGKVWVITDAVNDKGKRERTTVLLPNEY